MGRASSESRTLHFSTVQFGVTYVILALPTYVLPWLGSNSLVAALVSGGSVLLYTFLHCLCLIGLILIACIRAVHVRHAVLALLPVCAAMFDMVPGLSLIPFAPTAFHIATLATLAHRFPLDADR